MCSTCRPNDLPHATFARTARWSQALSLPSAGVPFRTVMLQRVPDRIMMSRVTECPVIEFCQSAKDRRVLTRVWGYMLIHEPGLLSSPVAPFIAALAARAFPSSPVYAFELALHFLLNVAPWIYDSHCLEALDNALRTRAPALHGHLNSIPGCTALHYIGLPCESLFISCFTDADWFQFWDAIFVTTDDALLFFRCSVALVEVHRSALMCCRTLSDVLAVLLRSKAPLEKIKKRLLTLSDLRLPLGPRQSILVPDGSRYTPLLGLLEQSQTKETVPPSQDAESLLRRISYHERELLREKENRLNALELTLAERTSYRVPLDEARNTRSPLVHFPPFLLSGPGDDAPDNDSPPGQPRNISTSREAGSTAVPLTVEPADSFERSGVLPTSRDRLVDRDSLTSPTPTRPSTAGLVQVCPLRLSLDGRSLPRSTSHGGKYLSDSTPTGKSVSTLLLDRSSTSAARRRVSPSSSSGGHVATQWIASPPVSERSDS